MTNMFLNFFKKLFRSRNVSQLSFFALLFQQKMYESVVKENEGLKKELLKPQAWYGHFRYFFLLREDNMLIASVSTERILNLIYVHCIGSFFFISKTDYVHVAQVYFIINIRQFSSTATANSGQFWNRRPNSHDCPDVQRPVQSTVDWCSCHQSTTLLPKKPSPSKLRHEDNINGICSCLYSSFHMSSIVYYWTFVQRCTEIFAFPFQASKRRRWNVLRVVSNLYIKSFDFLPF